MANPVTKRDIFLITASSVVGAITSKLMFDPTVTIDPSTIGRGVLIALIFGIMIGALVNWISKN